MHLFYDSIIIYVYLVIHFDLYLFFYSFHSYEVIDLVPCIVFLF